MLIMLMCMLIAHCIYLSKHHSVTQDIYNSVLVDNFRKRNKILLVPKFGSNVIFLA